MLVPITKSTEENAENALNMLHRMTAKEIVSSNLTHSFLVLLLLSDFFLVKRYDALQPGSWLLPSTLVSST